jgi:hypothetical protein
MIMETLVPYMTLSFRDQGGRAGGGRLSGSFAYLMCVTGRGYVTFS